MSSNPAYFISELSEKKRVAEDCYTLFFESEIEAIPGQFFMLWIPGVDEIPMSVSHIEKKSIGITVKIVGEATDTLCSLQVGNRIRIRGAYGRGFDLRGGEVILVAGGVGSAPLLPLASSLIEKDCRVIAIIGAKSERNLVHVQSFENIGAETMIATDDGSSGYHGTAARLFSDIFEDRKFDSVYCCGPEPMIVSVIETAERKKLWGQAAIERFIRCGIGICGSCAIEDKLVCRDGPVFNFNELKNLIGFGSR